MLPPAIEAWWTFGKSLRGIFENIYLNNIYCPLEIKINIDSAALDMCNIPSQLGKFTGAAVLSKL